MANCRSCDAPIRWVRWQESRKIMPLDAEPASDGNVVIVDGHTHGDGTPLVRTAKDGDAMRFKSHFATCKQAGDWRRKP